MTSPNSPGANPQAIVGACEKIKKAINEAPLDDLIAVIEKDYFPDSDTKRLALSRLDDAITTLEELAYMGNCEAIDCLASQGCRIASILARLVYPAEEGCDPQAPRDPGTQVIETGGENSNRYGEAAMSFTEATDLLLKLPPTTLEEIHSAYCDRFPESELSTPLDGLRAALDPSVRSKFAEAIDADLENNVLLVQEICDRLIGQRFTSKRRETARHAAAQSWIWPAAISASDYHKSMPVDECLPSLGLGSELPVSLRGKTWQTGSAAAFALDVFAILEKERSLWRPESHMKELRRSDEAAEPASLDAMIKTAATRRASRPPVTPSGLQRCTWSLENIWIRKAALLPVLSPDKSSIKKWAEAGFAFAASVCEGHFDKFQWPTAVVRRIGSKCAVKSAIKETLTAGLEQIAKAPQSQH